MQKLAELWKIPLRFLTSQANIYVNLSGEKKKDKIDIKQNACPTDFMNYFSWNAMNKVYKYQYYSSILLWLTLAVRSQKTCMCEHPNFG